jgi:hypothetical protein
LLVLLDLEFAEQQLRGLVISFGARDREDDDLVACLVLRTSPELEEPSVGQRPSELMEDEVSGDFTLEDRERRDASDCLGTAGRVRANGVRHDDAVHDRIGARVELLIGDRHDAGREGQPCAEREQTEHERGGNSVHPNFPFIKTFLFSSA